MISNSLTLAKYSLCSGGDFNPCTTQFFWSEIILVNQISVFSYFFHMSQPSYRKLKGSHWKQNPHKKMLQDYSEVELDVALQELSRNYCHCHRSTFITRKDGISVRFFKHFLRLPNMISKTGWQCQEYQFQRSLPQYATDVIALQLPHNTVSTPRNLRCNFYHPPPRKSNLELQRQTVYQFVTRPLLLITSIVKKIMK